MRERRHQQSGWLARAALAGVLALMIAGPAAAMQLTSPDFAEGATIAKAQVYPMCGGENISPALTWSGAPQGVKSFALTVIDPDARAAGWVHWVAVDIPSDVSSLAKGAKLPAGAFAVPNDFGNAHYDGPCPPTGSGVHHYQFTLWALGGPTPALEGKMQADAITTALSQVAIAKATLTGIYER